MTSPVRATSTPIGFWTASLGAAALALVIAAATPLTAATTWLISFTIDGNHADDGVNVMADQPAPYADYRIEQDPHHSPCVESALAPGGGLHAVFNRKVDSAGTRCNPAGSDRQFVVAITAEGPCTRLFNAYGPAAVSVNGDGTCVLFYNDNPRVRVGSLFAKASRTPVAFLTGMTGISTSYEIRTETDAFVTAPSANQRVVTYMGMARLWEFRPGQKTRPVEAPFSLKHQMTFTRHAQ